MGFRAVVFDFDGVLVDSEPLHFRALRESLLPEGVVVDPEQYRERYMAYDDRTCIRLALESEGLLADLDRIDAVARRKEALFEALAGSAPLFPGARELVGELRGRVPLAIASGARRCEIETILAALGLREPFTVIVGADDCRRHKPHPEPYLAAAARLGDTTPGLLPADCVALEDTVAGIASARAAGMTVVGVAQSHPPETLQLAHRVVRSLADLEAGALLGG